MKSLIVLAALHGADCDRLQQEAQSLQSQWNYMVYASSGVPVGDLDNLPLRRVVIRSIQRFNRSCQ